MAGSTQGVASLDARIIENFDGENYPLWRWRIQLLLTDKGLWEIVAEDTEEPVEAEARKEYKAKCSKAFTYIGLTLGDVPASQILEAKTPRQAWKRLEAIYEAKSMINKLAVKRELGNLRYVEGESIQKHIDTMRKLMRRLASLGAPIEEKEQIYTILCSLPSSYDTLIQVLESKEEVDEVVAQLLQEELRRTKLSAGAHKNEEAALVSREEGWRRPFQGGRSPWRGRGGRYAGRETRDLRSIRCYECGELGHYARNCLKEQAHTVEETSADDVIALMTYEEGVEQQEKGDLCLGVTEEETRRDHEWFFDSGATSHMSHTNEAMHGFKQAEDQRAVTVGNKGKLAIAGEGEIHIKTQQGENFRFKNVLYIPGIAKNLISVSALTKKGAIVTFHRSGCDVMKGGKLLATRSEEPGGLFKMDKMNEACLMLIEDTTLWHRRLGHIGYKYLEAMIN